MAAGSTPAGSLDDSIWLEIEKVLEEDSDMEIEPVIIMDPPKKPDSSDAKENTGTVISDPEMKLTEEPVAKRKIDFKRSKIPQSHVQEPCQIDMTTQESNSSEDDLPLKTIQCRIRNEETNKDSDVVTDSDDSVNDPTFSIKEEMKKIRKGKQRCTVRDRGWKKKATSLSNKKKACPGRPTIQGKTKEQSKTNNSEFQKVLKHSKKLFTAKQIVLKYHTNTLDALLASNGLQRRSMSGDGNCFFSAIQDATVMYKDQNELRRVVCDYIKDHEKDFKPFLAEGHQQQSQFNDQIMKLRENGTWSVELADALPLATANTLQREIVIYSSSSDYPVTRIKPTTTDKADESTIGLSYLKVIGFEHYDGVEALKASYTPLKRRTASKGEINVTPKKKCRAASTCVTPQKQANYISPKRKKLSRKNQKRPEKWKRNIRKKLRLAGKEYTSTAGKTVQAKAVQDTDCSKCRYKCQSKISQEQRLEIFSAYWNLENYQRQRDFICTNVTEHKPTRILTSAKRSRQTTRVFSFQFEGNQQQVCKKFFLKTLDIGQRCIDTALKAGNDGTYGKSDGRGRHPPHNITPKGLLDEVRTHIESFPVVGAHYTRKDTNRRFLGCDLNIKKMYSLYVDYCKAKGKKCVGHTVYRKTFCEEYNFSFHVPKKDQCPICVTYRQAEENGELTDLLKSKYEEHQKRKTLARVEKDRDKKFCKEKESYYAATFDLEAVLPVPCSLVSQVYYKRKLACYNFSVYSLADGKASCYLWNECEGKRGSNEIATCLLLYLKSLSFARHVCFYSDSCTGQNRNRFVFTALLHAVVTLPNIDAIDQKYLETGHTQMECDSMHAAIEKAKRITSVYVPSQWDTVVRMARKKNSYFVVPIKHGDILNFKPATQKIMPTTSVDVNGRKVKWMKIVWVQVRKRNPDSMFFKYSFDQTEFHEMKMRRARRGSFSVETEMPKSYTGKLPIADAKKKDLLSLCKSNIIPEEFHSYYDNMPSSSSAMDCLPAPDMEENEMDSEED